MDIESATIAVVFGGPSPEHDVSILTGLQAARELASSGRSVTALYWSKTGDWYRVDNDLEAAAFAQGVPASSEALRLQVGPGGGFSTVGGRFGRGRSAAKLSVDVAVNCCHGGPGEDGTLQSAFDLAGIAYSGPSVAGASLGMDKLAFASVCESAGLKTLPRRLLEESTKELDFPPPYIVKPRFGGSSIGVEVVGELTDAVDLKRASVHLRRGAVVEPYRPDLYDLNVAARSWPELRLSAVEKPLRGEASSEILGYADKYAGGEGMASAPRELPASLSTELHEQMTAATRVLSGACMLRGVARFDFLGGSGELFVNEVNTIPGSLARYLWVDPPVSFRQLLEDLVREALEVPAFRYSASGADGAILRGAGSIAGKLA